MKLAYEELFLLGMWRKGARFRTRLSKQIFKIGDVLLLVSEIQTRKMLLQKLTILV